MRLQRNFFEKKTLQVAKELLGCFLIRKIGRKTIIARIIETEAYCGPKDLANHASKGKTTRTAVMFGRAGQAYIYLIYGMYYCFNIVTGKIGYPAAVLIRGVEIIDVPKIPSPKSQVPNNFQIQNSKLSNITTINIGQRPIRLWRKQQSTKILGPGKVCRELQIDKNFQGADLIKNNSLYFICPADGFSRRSGKNLLKIKRLPRVGVDYAGKYKDKKWRFVLEC